MERPGQDSNLRPAAWRWVREWSPWVRTELCHLIVFNQFGEVVRRTGRVKPVEPGALTQEEVITEIIAPGIAQANADLDRRNRDAPKPESKPPPLDRATLRFIEP